MRSNSSPDVHRTASPSYCTGESKGTTEVQPGAFSRKLVLGLLLSFVAAGASAQSHEVQHGEVVLRSSTVASDRIDPATARQHGIEPSPDRAVLNVILLSAGPGSPKTLPARVSASTRNLAGVRNEIEMREVREKGRVSYIGSYAFAPREVLDFEVTALPAGAAGQAPVTLRYRERMWAR